MIHSSVDPNTTYVLWFVDHSPAGLHVHTHVHDVLLHTVRGGQGELGVK